jgi:hypothetical protein
MYPADKLVIEMSNTTNNIFQEYRTIRGINSIQMPNLELAH